MQSSSALSVFVRHDQRGFTGGEKALLICFGLAIMILVGVLLRSGGEKAAGDAQKTLQAGGRGSVQLGQVVAGAPMAGAGDIKAAGAIQKPGAEEGPYHFISTPTDDAPVQRPAPGPASGDPPPGTWSASLNGSGQVTAVRFSGYRYDIARNAQGQVQSITLVYPGAVGSHPLDGQWQRLTGPGVIQAGYAPGRVAVEVWNTRRQPGTAQVDESGFIHIRRGDQTVVFQPTGTVFMADRRNDFVYWPGDNGRLSSVRTPSGEYSFGYNQGGQLTVVVIRRPGGVEERWTRQGTGWLGPSGQRLSGPNGPQTWPDLLLNQPQIVAVADRSVQQIGDLRRAIGTAWQQALSENPGRFVTGIGFSGNGVNVIRMSNESEQILQRYRALQTTVQQLRGATDPREIARLTDQFVRQDNQLRAQLNAFNNNAQGVIRSARIAGDVHAIAGDIYSLGNNSFGYGSSNVWVVAWERGSALHSVYGLSNNIYRLSQDFQAPTTGPAPPPAGPRR